MKIGTNKYKISFAVGYKIVLSENMKSFVSLDDGIRKLIVPSGASLLTANRYAERMTSLLYKQFSERINILFLCST